MSRDPRRLLPAFPGSWLPFFVTGLGLISNLAAQVAVGTGGVDPDPVRERVALPPPHVPIHTAAADSGVAYGTWAAGHDYKVSFHDGMTFVPYLGADYPHNQPWSWRTVSVAVGGVELLEPARQVGRWHDDYRYEYRLGTVTEAYDVRTDGLEQTFIVGALPGDGDLVVRGRVTTALQSPDQAARHGDLTFIDAAGDPIIGYGAAFVFDATGRRLPITTARRGEEIELRVPAAWLAEATLPVTVDPLLTRRQVTAWSGWNIRSVDIGRDDRASTANVMIVSVAAASQFDDDVSARLCDDDYTSRAQVFQDITTSWDADGACCAYVAGGTKWAIVFRRYFYGSGIRTSRLRARVHQSGNLTNSTQVTHLTGAQPYNDLRPDVGGTRLGSTGSAALVVFEREDNSAQNGNWRGTDSTDVYGVLLDVSTTAGTFLAPFQIAGSTVDFERPSVNQEGDGAGFSWITVFQAHDNSNGDDWDVLGRRIDSTGTVANGLWTSALGGNGLRHQFAPKIAGRGGRYAVTFSTAAVASTVANKPSTTSGDEVWVERFDWLNGVSGPTAGHPPQQLTSNSQVIYEATGIAYDHRSKSHWAVGYRQHYPAPAQARIARVGYTGARTEGSYVMYSVTGDVPGSVAVTFDDDHDDFLCAYGVGRSTTDPIYGQTLEYRTPTLWSRAGTSCSNVGMSWVGRQQIGSELSGPFVYNAQSTTGHFLLVSLGTSSQPIVDPAVAAGCNLLVDNGAGLLGTMAFRIGADVSWQLPLPEWLPPLTLHFQDWLLDGTTFRSSRRLTVPVVK
ncbi:MAG: hypothetical protein NXI31_23475 [bacterium]|nr:hypothetical protein [bacterium]